MSQEYKLPVIAQIEDEDLIWSIHRNCERTVLMYVTDRRSGERINKIGPMTLSDAFKRCAGDVVAEYDFLSTASDVKRCISGMNAVRPKNSITASIHSVNQ